MIEKKVGFRRISNKAVRAKTGKDWEEWFAILDKWGAKEKGHTRSTKYILEYYGLSPCWMVCLWNIKFSQTFRNLGYQQTILEEPSHLLQPILSQCRLV